MATAMVRTDRVERMKELIATGALDGNSQRLRIAAARALRQVRRELDTATARAEVNPDDLVEHAERFDGMS